MINWNILSLNRSKLMGVAIILIMLYHLGFSSILNIGVDIFLILSGMSVYYSLRANSKLNIFYKKRIVRIIPEFLLVSVPVSLIYMIVDKKSIQETITIASGISVFLNYGFIFWFIPLILICYCLAPLIFRIQQYEDIKKQIGILTICTVCYILAFKIHSSFILFIRIPIFILGMYVAPKIYQSIPLSSKMMIFNGISSMVGIPLSMYMIYNRYDWLYVFMGYSLYILQLTILIAFILQKINIPILSFFGGISLELYLLHESLCIRFCNLLFHNATSGMRMIFCPFLSILIAILAAWLLKTLNNKILRL